MKEINTRNELTRDDQPYKVLFDYVFHDLSACPLRLDIQEIIRIVHENYLDPELLKAQQLYTRDEVQAQVDQAYCDGAEKGNPIQWISVNDRPLIEKLPDGWRVTDDGINPFMAALPYNDARKPNEELWWIRHCVIEDEIGLCVVGDDDNIPAGWQIEDVTHWMPLPSPPKTEL